ncbi:hypothetical protein L1987_87985 [Smallanthus sonchifolius]|nr:hypothetical protein L1987_89920 [Smallanthus sonchifolius]KAI3664412.1 hypothetical protein L1987_89840 [Smallanthus sonchifolius]KAI3664606.1 hypothetical protein L1987_89630 [Smallanthus sonchifolius]KAI3666212.1 hypothetical protein L1987_89294 [Smallanthus sonchifolius]KAI3666218.1 hypothetical protein L1987_89284 [Smallanthus sonchifolius]
MLSKATELLNHGLRERAKAETEMLMAGIDAHNRMLENKPITIERAGEGLVPGLSIHNKSLLNRSSNNSLYFFYKNKSGKTALDTSELRRMAADEIYPL